MVTLLEKGRKVVTTLFIGWAILGDYDVLLSYYDVVNVVNLQTVWFVCLFWHESRVFKGCIHML